MIPLINRLYRKIFCRGGHGIHSPFVFDLITTVIEEKRPFYCYEQLSAVRRQIGENCDKIECCGREYAVKDILSRFCFSERDSRLLFRLANRFQPQSIYVFGSDLGLAPLYLTSWSERADCVVFEPVQSIAAIARKIVYKYSPASINISVSSNPEITDNRFVDLIVWGNSYTDTSKETRATGDTDNRDNTFSIDTFRRFLPLVNDNSIMVISGINSSGKNRDTWKMVCVAPKVSVTIDLYSLGIVFFNPKLHRKTYKN